MKTTYLCLQKYVAVSLLTLLITTGYAQVDEKPIIRQDFQKVDNQNQKGTPLEKTAQKAPEKATTNVVREAYALPSDFPIMNFTGDPVNNFYSYIQEKTVWFQNNPTVLSDKKGLTRISKSYFIELPEHIQDYINEHIIEFQILGK